MDHKCDSNCKGRVASGGVACYKCKEISYAKCIGIDKATQIKMQASKSVIKLVCLRCQSTDTQVSNDSHLLKQILDKLSLITAPVITDPPNPTNVHASTENPIEKPNTVQNLTVDNIFKLVLKLSDKVDKLHSQENESKSVTALTQLISSKLSELSENIPVTNQSMVDLLDDNRLTNWSMSNDIANNTIHNMGRASISVKQSIDEDVLNILSRSEKLTWETLDILKADIAKKFEEFSEKIDSISLNAHVSNPTNTSALVSSISIDAIDGLVGKVDSIDGKIDQVSSNLGTLATDVSTGFTITNQIVDKIDSIDNNIVKHINSTPHQTVIDLANSFAINANNNDILTNSFLQGELDEELEELDKTVIENSAVSDSDSVGDRSFTFDSIHDISGNNIDGNIASATPTSNAQQVESSSQNLQNPTVVNMPNKMPVKPRIRELHLTKLSTNLKENNIRKYMRYHGILNADELSIIKLVKKDVDLTRLSFVSFKIDVDDATYDKVIVQQFWPPGSVIKDFKPKAKALPKKSDVAQADHFLVPGPSPMTTK